MQNMEIEKEVQVSVIVPNYNYARYLPMRIESILNQTFTDFELILLDDASTDESVSVLENIVIISTSLTSLSTSRTQEAHFNNG